MNIIRIIFFLVYLIYYTDVYCLIIFYDVNSFLSNCIIRCIFAVMLILAIENMLCVRRVLGRWLS
jgi:hypothetical protein